MPVYQFIFLTIEAYMFYDLLQPASTRTQTKQDKNTVRLNTY